MSAAGGLQDALGPRCTPPPPLPSATPGPRRPAGRRQRQLDEPAAAPACAPLQAVAARTQVPRGWFIQRCCSSASSSRRTLSGGGAKTCRQAPQKCTTHPAPHPAAAPAAAAAQAPPTCVSARAALWGPASAEAEPSPIATPFCRRGGQGGWEAQGDRQGRQWGGEHHVLNSGGQRGGSSGHMQPAQKWHLQPSRGRRRSARRCWRLPGCRGRGRWHPTWQWRRRGRRRRPAGRGLVGDSHLSPPGELGCRSVGAVARPVSSSGGDPPTLAPAVALERAVPPWVALAVDSALAEPEARSSRPAVQGAREGALWDAAPRGRRAGRGACGAPALVPRPGTRPC